MADGAGTSALARSGIDRGFLLTLPPATADRIVGEAIRVDVPSGAVVYREEDEPQVIVVVRGVLRVFLRSADGREVTVRYARSGDVAGLPLLLGGPGPMTIAAVTPASLLALRTATLRELLASDALVARASAEQLAHQVYDTMDELAEQAFGSVPARLARAILDLAVPRGAALEAPVTQQQLADAIGSVREVVARELHELRAAGIVATGRGAIVVLDVAALAARSDPDVRPWRPPGRGPPGTRWRGEPDEPP